MWVPWEEDDPVVWHYPGRKSVGYFGAVRLRDGRGFFRQEPAMFDGATFWAFLAPIGKRRQETGRRVIVIIDNAKYHHAKLHAAWRAGTTGHDLPWTSCRLTARNSTRSSGCGSERGETASTMCTFPSWQGGGNGGDSVRQMVGAERRTRHPMPVLIHNKLCR